MFASIKSSEVCNSEHVFSGHKSGFRAVYGMQREFQVPQVPEDFIRDMRAHTISTGITPKSKMSKMWNELMRKYYIHGTTTDSSNPPQNPPECSL